MSKLTPSACLPFGAALAAALLASAPTAQTATGVLNSNGIFVDNSQVSFHFYKQSGETRLDITDLSSSHAFQHRGPGLWEMELADLLAPGVDATDLTTLMPGDCSSTIQWRKTVAGSYEEVELTWTSCSTAAMGSDAAAVSLLVQLEDGESIADWTLTATSNMQRFTFWSGSIHLSIEEDDANGDHYLLDPLGYLTENPAVNLPTWALGDPDSTEIAYPILHATMQIAAYYDDGGNGLYMSGADPSGEMARAFLHKSVDPGGGALPRVDYKAKYYTDDFFDAGSDYSAVPMRVGRFDGDWYDAADEYRSWIESVQIGSGGLIVDRTDVSDVLKNIQQAVVMSPMEDFGISATGDVRTVADGVEDYLDHWGLEEVFCVNFGSTWLQGDACGIGEYLFDSAWQSNVTMMNNAGLPLFVYMLDSAYSYVPPTLPGCSTSQCTSFDSWNLEGWADQTIELVDGSLHAQDCTEGDFTIAVIDPSTPEWRDRMLDLADELETAGIDGIYVDNHFPVYDEACFATTHGHLPGLGTSYAGGQVQNTLDVLHDSGSSSGDFMVFTEVGMEAQLSHLGVMGRIQPFGDFHGDVTEMNTVPVEAVVYHHLGVPTGTMVSSPWLQFASDLAKFNLPFEDSVWIDDTSEQLDARRGAMFNIAYTIVNGGWVQVPDLNAPHPKKEPWSFEISIAPGTPQWMIDAIDHYQDIVAFAAAGSLYRGTTSAQPYLNVGRRLRDLEFTSTIPMIDVPHQVWGIGPMAGNGPQIKPEPQLLSSVWQDVDHTNRLGLMFSNHGRTTLSGVTFDFVPGDYGLSNTASYQVIRVAPGQSDQVIYTGTGTQTVTLPAMLPETFFFVMIRQ